MIRLDEAAGLRAAGGKAETLARARAAGLRVPDGIIVLPDEEIDPPGIAAALARLGGERFAVRSSADVEDRPGASAAGVFDSVVGVTKEEVPAAIEKVRVSVHRQAARAYLGSRGIGRARMAVLVQPMVAASALGVLHTAGRSDGRGNGTMRAEERDPGEPEWGQVSPRDVAQGDLLARGALRLAALCGGEADIEYALTNGGPVFLQARPLAPAPPFSDETWDPGDDALWRRDAEHNPDPLSEAQRSLVALARDLPGAPPSCVLHGYLFYSGERTAPPARVIPPNDLPRLFHDEIVPACDAALAPFERASAGATDPERLGAVLAAWRIVLARYVGEVAPSLARARAHLDQLLRANLGEPLLEHGALLAATGGPTVDRDSALWRIGRADPMERPGLIATYNERFGAWAPAWDVAVPCDDEFPTRVLAMAALVARGPSPELRSAESAESAASASAAVLDRLDRMARGAFKHLLPVVRAALPIAEADDGLFFRAQRVVRRALLARGDRLYRDGTLDDPALIFELPIECILAGEVDRATAEENRAQRRAGALLAPPSEIRARRPTWQGGGAGGVLRGSGTCGRGLGRVYVLHDPAAAPAALPRGAVLVTAAILPSLAYLIPGAAALVTDHGGALSHGATLAREYGVPAVLGTGRATTTLSDGEDVIVDADAGRVYRIAPTATA
ncbi:MAG: hypothetical protein EXR72_05770 [Myxococcales bacterium]|nr:hypothetical protein [Myxococcales bacterium]